MRRPGVRRSQQLLLLGGCGQSDVAWLDIFSIYSIYSIYSSYNIYTQVGVAFAAGIGGVRMLDGTITDAVEAR